MKRPLMKNRRSSKRSQITLFIVLGIILLFAIALIFYIKNRIVESNFQQEINPVIETVPFEFDPVQEYVTECLHTTAKAGITAIGQQGGYYKPESHSITANAESPTEGKAVSFGSTIPYWFYLATPNECKSDTCRMASERPELTRVEETTRQPYSIESELESYINDNLPYCLNDMQSLRNIGYTFDALPKPAAKVTITTKDIKVSLNFPMSASKENARHVFKSFFTTLDVNIMRVYDFAQTLTNRETSDWYMEKYMMQMISTYSGVGELIPPATSEVTVMPGNGKYWVKSQVKELVQNDIIAQKTQILQVPYTLNARPDPEDPYAAGMYGWSNIPLNSSLDVTDFTATFNYFTWYPVYFNIHGVGADGEVIEAEQITPDLAIIPVDLKRYQYYYDFSYPVIVELNDKSAFDGEGYTFRFAMEVNVRNNKPVFLGEAFPLSSAGASTQLCDERQGVVDYIFIVNDGSTGKPIPDAQVVYGSYRENCPLGYTWLYDNPDSRLDGKAVLRKKLPVCVGEGCYLTVSKYGYSSYTEQVSANYGEIADDTHYEKTISLYPKKSLDLSVKQIKLVRNTNDDTKKESPWVLNQLSKDDLLSNEMAIVTFKRIAKSPSEPDYTQVAMITGKQIAKVDLIPGDYDLDIQLQYTLPSPQGSSILIQETMCTEQETNPIKRLVGGGCKKYETIRLDEINNSLPIGKTYLTEDTAPYIVTNDIYDANAIELYALALPGENFFNLTITDYQEASKGLEYSQQNRNQIQPVLKK